MDSKQETNQESKQDKNQGTNQETNSDPYSDTERYKRVERYIYGIGKEDAAKGGRVTVEEKRKREAEIRQCVSLGMSVAQMVEFLPTRGFRLSRSAIYEYLKAMKLPRNYKPGQYAQSHHDFFTLNAITRIAKDAHPRKLTNIAKGKSPGDGAGFRHDFCFEIDQYLFFGEIQLSDLAQTDWRRKAKNYVRWYEKIGMPFRVLFIVDQKRDMATVRRRCREVLEQMGHPNLNLFLFLTLDDLKVTGRNLAYDPVWLTKGPDMASLL